MKQKRSMKWNVLFLILIFSLTSYALLKDQNLKQLVELIHEANTWYLLVAVFFVIIFVCGESVILHYMLRKIGKKTSRMSCIKYSFIGFFVSCITPSASGGQPAQIYYMKKDGIDISIATPILMIVTIGYKLVLVVLGIWFMLFERTLWNQYMTSFTEFLFYFGMLCNVIGIGGLLIFIFIPSFAKKLVYLGHKILSRLHILKEREEVVVDSMEQYQEISSYFHSHIGVLIVVFFLSVLQRVCLFYVTYLVYRSFGLHGVNWYVIVMLQTIIAICVEMLPLPGGMGVSEKLFLILFLPIFGHQLLFPAMLLSRGISYYVLLLLSAIVTAYAHLKVMIGEREERER